MCDREVRSGNSRRKVRNKGGGNHQTTILDLVRPTAHELSRAGFPPPLTLSCCGTTYLQRGNGVDVQGDSTTLYPAHCRDQRTRVTRSWEVAWIQSSGASFMPNLECDMRVECHVEVPKGEHFQ